METLQCVTESRMLQLLLCFILLCFINADNGEGWLRQLRRQRSTLRPCLLVEKKDGGRRLQGAGWRDGYRVGGEACPAVPASSRRTHGRRR